MTIKNHKGMWLKQCSDLVPNICSKSSSMKSAYGKNTLFYVFKYDIKEFFTNVIIDHVMPALQFFIVGNDKINQGLYGFTSVISAQSSLEKLPLTFKK